MPTIFGTKLNIYNNQFPKSAILNAYKEETHSSACFHPTLYTFLYSQSQMLLLLKIHIQSFYILLNRFSISALWGKTGKSKQTTQTTLKIIRDDSLYDTLFQLR